MPRFKSLTTLVLSLSLSLLTSCSNKHKSSQHCSDAPGFFAKIACNLTPNNTATQMAMVNTLLKKHQYKKSLYWLKKLVKKNNPVAEHNLAVYYYKGYGVPKDPKKAFQWTKKSAQQGLAIAQGLLGACYSAGYGVPKDPKKAFQWTKKSAQQGNALAEYNLGYLYHTGFGVAKDPINSLYFIRKAAYQGLAIAQQHLREHQKNDKWAVLARYNIGSMYYSQGTAGNRNKALHYFLQAANKGNPFAENMLGVMRYHEGTTTKDTQLAAQWFQKGAAQEFAPAQCNLATLLLQGKGTEKNQKKAFALYQKSAKKGNLYAQNNLAYLYAKGIGHKKDSTQAQLWHKKAMQTANTQHQQHCPLYKNSDASKPCIQAETQLSNKYQLIETLQLSDSENVNIYFQEGLF
jgi:uncharacterized protein